MGTSSMAIKFGMTTVTAFTSSGGAGNFTHRFRLDFGGIPWISAQTHLPSASLTTGYFFLLAVSTRYTPLIRPHSSFPVSRKAHLSPPILLVHTIHDGKLQSQDATAAPFEFPYLGPYAGSLRIRCGDGA